MEQVIDRTAGQLKGKGKFHFHNETLYDMFEFK